ncbi:adenylate/guanylate cyclase domain-containing protein [Trichocoleus sp. ST-U3]|uniref:CHASE2 domain-containing protein n=1 Tax=Coleofasciculus sp. FACHB-542 TaxID=2692787 RepID=UPI0018EF8D27|nr:adenylate/guanylate cyclase domain-containing protein [Coleofasciculus sp. FACHB-542]
MVDVFDGINVLIKNWFKKNQRFISSSQSIVPGAMVGLLSVGLWQIGAWQPLERLVYSALFQARSASILPQTNWDRRVAVIAIDDASLKKYGKFPWSRDRYAQLLQKLEPASPAVIGFDVLFVDPGQGDEKFAKAIAKSGNVILATAWDNRGQPLEILPELKKAALGEGQIWHNPDADGISRQAALFFGTKPALGLAMLLEAPEAVSLPHLAEVQRRKDVWINWPGPTQNVSTYSYASIMEGKVDAKAFANKFVLVGVTATAIDRLRSPYNQNPPTAGVYLHAALIDNLLNDKLLHTLPKTTVMLLLLGIAPITSWLLLKQGVWARMAIAILLPSGWVIFALSAFIDDGWWLPIVAPVGTSIAAGIGVQLREQYEKQQLMSLFAKHVAPEMADLIWHRKDEIFHKGKLQAQEMMVTVLFADIRGFTSISEKLPPGELIEWLNLFLDAMTDCIMDRGGVIDKYIGDAIMAVFGIPFSHTTPEEIQQDALNAIAAGIAMQERLKKLNQRFHNANKPTIEIGIGIHTGPVVAGSVGGSRRLNYSVLGDTVNVAARLEPMNKEVKIHNPYQMIVSGSTFAYASDRYHGPAVRAIQLRGREQATIIYCIQGEKVNLADPAEALAPPLNISA